MPAYADPEGEFEWEFAITGEYSFDVLESDSLVAPYDGDLVLEMIWYANGNQLTGSDLVLEAAYEYRDENWVLVHATRCMDFLRQNDWDCDDDRDQEAFWREFIRQLPSG